MYKYAKLYIQTFLNIKCVVIKAYFLLTINVHLNLIKNVGYSASHKLLINLYLSVFFAIFDTFWDDKYKGSASLVLNHFDVKKIK